MKQVAMITTVYTPSSACQTIGDCFLLGYPQNGRWQSSGLKVTALYCDRKPADDISAARAGEFGFRAYPTVAEALRLGGERLAVDGVLLFGGNRGHDLFQQCVEVFEKDHRAVPVFYDGCLADSFERSKSMVDRSHRLGFPVLAGTALPLALRLPDMELPLDCEIEDALMVSPSALDSADAGALEALQAMVERRQGAETGVKAVQVLEGEAVWKAADEGRWSRDLLKAALARSDSPLGFSVKDGRPQDLIANGELYRLARNPAACLIQYNSGLDATLLLIEGAVRDYTFAARVRGRGIQSTQFLFPPSTNNVVFPCLANRIEQLFEDGKPPYPPERALLVSGILENCFISRQQDHGRIATPFLNLRYEPPRLRQYGYL